MLNVPPKVYEKDIVILSTALALEVEKDIKPRRENQSCQQTLLRLPSIKNETDSNDKQQNRESPQQQSSLICPHCGHEQRRAETCQKCGVIFKKYKKNSEKSSQNLGKSGQNRTAPPSKDHKIAQPLDNSKKKRTSGFLNKFLSFKTNKGI